MGVCRQFPTVLENIFDFLGVSSPTSFSFWKNGLEVVFVLYKVVLRSSNY